MSQSPVEPSSDFRQAAMGLFEMYVAFKDAGFNEQQSLQLVAILATNGSNE